MALLMPLSLALLIAHAAGATFSAASPDFYRFAFGDVNVTIIQDGLLTFPDNPFLVPQDLVLRSFFFYNPGSNPYKFTQNVVLLQRGKHTVLVDSGSGKGPTFFGTAGKLILNLRSVGVRPDDITHVLLTHGHFDHVGGLVNLDGTPAFPRARLILSQREVNFWNSAPADIIKTTPFVPPAFVDGMIQTFKTSMLAYKGRRRLIGDLSFVLPGIEMFHTPGHTPGHMAVRIRSRGKSFFIVGDAFHTRTTNIQNPDWNINTDVNVTAAVATKMKVLNFLANKRHLVLTYHAPFPGLGYVHHLGPFFDWSSFVQL